MSFKKTMSINQLQAKLQTISDQLVADVLEVTQKADDEKEQLIIEYMRGLTNAPIS